MLKRIRWIWRAMVALLVVSLLAAPVPVRVAEAATPTYRALLIGNNAYIRSPLKGCINDAQGLRSALMLSTGVEYARIALQTNLTATGLASALDAAKGWGQGQDDVTLVYYSGHGYSNASGAGIIGTDMVGVPFSDVESRLAKIPGTVCVLIDACYSGAIIGKASGNGAASARAYNAQVLAAFGAGTQAKALGGAKYHVITACSQSQQSFEAGGFGYFTTGVTEAMGWNVTAGRQFGSLVGDANGDKQLSVGEAYVRAAEVVSALRADGDQSVQAAPANSGLIIAARAGSGDTAGTTLPGVSGLMNLQSVIMARGWSYQLTTSGTYSWKTTNDEVASASGTGVVTAFREGRATITGTRSGQPTITLQVEVAPLAQVVQKVKLDLSSASKKPGKTFTLKATVSPGAAKSRALKWYSTDTAVATVSQSGKVTTKKPGTCRIYALGSSGAVGICALTVLPQAVTKVQQKRGTASVKVGRVLQLAARALPTTASNRQLKWTSANERIAVIGEDSGIVRGLKKGKVWITAAAMDGSGTKSRCLVTVK